jgi:hypothetical protein
LAPAISGRHRHPPMDLQAKSENFAHLRTIPNPDMAETIPEYSGSFLERR